MYTRNRREAKKIIPDQLSQAPDFRDQEGVRTYAWADGRLANIARDGVPAQCHNHHDPQHRDSFFRMQDSQKGIAVMAVEVRSRGATAIAFYKEGPI